MLDAAAPGSRSAYASRASRPGFAAVVARRRAAAPLTGAAWTRDRLGRRRRSRRPRRTAPACCSTSRSTAGWAPVPVRDDGRQPQRRVRCSAFLPASTSPATRTCWPATATLGSFTTFSTWMLESESARSAASQRPRPGPTSPSACSAGSAPWRSDACRRRLLAHVSALRSPQATTLRRSAGEFALRSPNRRPPRDVTLGRWRIAMTTRTGTITGRRSAPGSPRPGDRAGADPRR